MVAKLSALRLMSVLALSGFRLGFEDYTKSDGIEHAVHSSALSLHFLPHRVRLLDAVLQLHLAGQLKEGSHEDSTESGESPDMNEAFSYLTADHPFTLTRASSHVFQHKNTRPLRQKVDLRRARHWRLEERWNDSS